MEMNLRPSLLPYAQAEISRDRVNIGGLQFRTIAVPHVERLLEQLVVRGRVGYVPQSGDRAAGSARRCGQFCDQPVGEHGAGAPSVIQAGRIGSVRQERAGRNQREREHNSRAICTSQQSHHTALLSFLYSRFFPHFIPPELSEFPSPISNAELAAERARGENKDCLAGRLRHKTPAANMQNARTIPTTTSNAIITASRRRHLLLIAAIAPTDSSPHGAKTKPPAAGGQPTRFQPGKISAISGLGRLLARATRVVLDFRYCPLLYFVHARPGH